MADSSDMLGNVARVLLLGTSPQLRAVAEWARARGFPITEEADEGVSLVAADEDVLDGLCTPRQGQLLARCRELGLTCLPPDLARAHLAELHSAKEAQGAGEAPGLMGIPGARSVEPEPYTSIVGSDLVPE